MSNALHIDHVEVRYRKDGSLVHGVLLFDDLECDNLLCFEAAVFMPQTIRDIVVFCRDEHCVNAIDLMERCAEEGHPAYLNGEPVDLAKLAAILAETRDG